MSEGKNENPRKHDWLKKASMWVGGAVFFVGLCIMGVVVAGMFGMAGFWIYQQNASQEQLLGECVSDQSRVAQTTQASGIAKTTNVSAVSHAKIANLPNDHCQYFSLFFLTPDWQTDPIQRNFMAWFDSDPRLHSLVFQTDKRIILTTSRQYTAKSDRSGYSFAQVTGKVVPTFILQNCNGNKCFKVSALSMPDSPEQLADDIQEALKNIPATVPVSPQNQPHNRLYNARYVTYSPSATPVYGCGMPVDSATTKLTYDPVVYRRLFPCHPDPVQEPAPVPQQPQVQAQPPMMMDTAVRKPPEAPAKSSSNTGMVIALVAIIVLVLMGFGFTFVMTIVAGVVSFLVNKTRKAVMHQS